MLQVHTFTQKGSFPVQLRIQWMISIQSSTNHVRISTIALKNVNSLILDALHPKRV